MDAMNDVNRDELLQRTAELAGAYLDGMPGRHVGGTASLEELREALGQPLPEDGETPLRVIEELAAGADRGLVGSAGPRYFGFVIGGSLPVALAADWLTSTWDQNAGLYATSPACSVVEETCGRWLVDLLGLPEGSSVGFTTGGLGANFTAIAAARRAVLLRADWDVERQGLRGAPPVHLVAGAEAHITIDAAAQMLGLGTAGIIRVAADEQGRIIPAALAQVLDGLEGPAIVCAQVGNVNTGAFDPVDEIASVMERLDNAWLHVDGAFGLWTAASPRLRALVSGIERADSWGTDAHKWLNVPYDSGIVVVRDPAAHRGAMRVAAAYLVQTQGDERDPFEYVPEFSRRARGFTVYAALRALGRRGVAELIERSTAHAARMAGRLASVPGVDVLNDVVLNQVLVRFEDSDALTREVVARVQADGTCWLGGTTWHGIAAMRISVSNWSTTAEDADRSVDAILRCLEEARRAGSRAGTTEPVHA